MTLSYLTKKRLEQDVTDLESFFLNSELGSVKLNNTFFTDIL